MKISQITDKKSWEEFLLKNSPQSLFQSWNWGDVIKNTSDQKVRFLDRFGIFDNENSLIGIFQMTKIEARRGTFIHLRHGPVLSSANPAVFKLLTDFLTQKAKNLHASFIRIGPLIAPTSENLNLFRKHGFRNSPMHRMDGEYCWVLDLDKSENELLSGMRKTTRYLIRQAIKLGVKINSTGNSNAVDEFLEIYSLTARRHHFVEHHGIKEEFEIFTKDDQVRLFTGFYQGKLLAAALVIFYGRQAIYHHSASVEQKIPVNYLLQWEVIREAKKRGKKDYNFWGIAPVDNPRHPWHNLTLFKKGFGGRIIEYVHSQDLPVDKISYWKTYLIESGRKLVKGY